jgi:hypothetical protein
MLAYPSRTGCDRQVCLARNNKLLAAALALARPARLGLALLLLGGAAQAQELTAGQFPVPQDDDPGYFEIRSATAELRGGVYFLSAWIEYRLSSAARDALQSGVPLTIRLDVELLNSRRFWFDNESASLRQLYRLEYHALSERYLVTNLNSGDQVPFGTLFAALNYLGRVDRLPLIDAALLEPDRDYELRLRAVLDVERFPGPLRLLAFWRRDWSLASDWYRWPLHDD